MYILYLYQSPSSASADFAVQYDRFCRVFGESCVRLTQTTFKIIRADLSGEQFHKFLVVGHQQNTEDMERKLYGYPADKTTVVIGFFSDLNLLHSVIDCANRQGYTVLT